MVKRNITSWVFYHTNKAQTSRSKLNACYMCNTELTTPRWLSHQAGNGEKATACLRGHSAVPKAADSEKPICFLVPTRPQRTPLTKIRFKYLQHIKNNLKNKQTNLDFIYLPARNKHQTSPALLLAP